VCILVIYHRSIYAAPPDPFFSLREGVKFTHPLAEDLPGPSAVLILKVCLGPQTVRWPASLSCPRCSRSWGRISSVLMRWVG
jgi:hypothetical protein